MTTSTTKVSNSPFDINPTIPVASRTIGSAVFQLMGNGLVPEAYDELVLAYTGSDLTSVVYKLSGVTIGTLTLAYTGANLTSVIRS